MAENKKSFIAYSDWNGMFKSLPDEVAGKLIKHIFSYVNDENPVSEDYVINALFEQIKSTLKRDLIKWEEQREQRSRAGKKSAEQRATKFNERSNSFNETQRNSTVNVSVSDSVNDKKESLETRSLKFKETLKPFIQEYGIEMIRNFFGYWSEPNQTKKKMKFELEKTWDTKRRLETWSKREQTFNTNKNNIPKSLGI